MTFSQALNRRAQASIRKVHWGSAPRPPGPEARSRLGQKNGKQHPGLLPHRSGRVALACKVL